MIQFEEALGIVLNHAIFTGEEQTGFESVTGRILSRDVYSDMDMPPFNKSAVDGYACRMRDAESGVEFRVIETIPAGSTPLKKIKEGECSRIMTGSMVPEGADAVIMVEDTKMTSTDTVKFIKENTAENICYRAENIKSGQKVLDQGTRVQAAHLAVLASVGFTDIWVARQPHIGIISTGNELVEPTEKPGGSQIRNTNAWQLYAQAKEVSARVSYFGIADDSPEALKDKITKGLDETDILIITGGVSMGDFDYVPAAMETAGAKILFKSIAIQPGRPTVFARYNDKFIFGLPGNPVSCYVLFELLVKPFILKTMGCTAESPVLSLPMGVDYSRIKSVRKSVIPVMIEKGAVYPVEYHGSAHINAYTKANGMMIMDIGQSEIKKGEPVDVRPL